MTATSEALPFELDSLAQAVNYQRWVSDLVQPLLGKRTLEVGCGIGNMSKWLPVRERLILTEFEPALLRILRERLPEYFGNELPRVTATSLDLVKDSVDSLRGEQIDTIVSFNVLEHIEDDGAAVSKLLDILRGTGADERRLVSFVPAQPWAFSKLDAYYGHFRRYSLKHIREVSRRVAPDAELRTVPFNALGLLGWMWSTKVLKNATIDPDKIRAFDAILPFTKQLDNLLCRKMGYPWGQSYLWVLTLR